MARKFAKGAVVKLSETVDCSNTGGPIIPKDTKGVVKKWEKFRDGVYIVDVEGHGLRRFYEKSLEVGG